MNQVRVLHYDHLVVNPEEAEEEFSSLFRHLNYLSRIDYTFLPALHTNKPASFAQGKIYSF